VSNAAKPQKQRVVKATKSNTNSSPPLHPALPLGIKNMAMIILIIMLILISWHINKTSKRISLVVILVETPL